MNMLEKNVNKFRFNLYDYENIHSWLSLLLDSYAVVDFSVFTAIENSNKKIVCSKGCSACCYQVIPLSTIESIGIKFYIQNILHQEYRHYVLENFYNNKQICIFNIDDSCAIYPLRPIACRRYLICSKRCNINEDPTITRPTDIITPSREYLYRAIEMTLPFYKSQNIHIMDNEHIFNFYKRNNVKLSSIYEKLIY